MSQYPLLFRVRQSFDSQTVEDIPATVETELSRLELATKTGSAPILTLPLGGR